MLRSLFSWNSCFVFSACWSVYLSVHLS